jgi:hypothetical protein
VFYLIVNRGSVLPRQRGGGRGEWYKIAGSVSMFSNWWWWLVVVGGIVVVWFLLTGQNLL